MRAVYAPALILAFSAPALAETPAGTSEVYACAAIESDSERLACYDSAVGRLKAAEEAGEVATITRAEVEEVKKDSFGFSIPSLPKLALPKLGGDKDADGALKEIQQTVTSAKLNSYKKAVVELESGQVWQQTDSTKITISKKRPPETATVKAASMGSYMMKLDNGRSFKVKRIK